MTSQALATIGGAAGGGPQWQVDIPGLSQLIVSVGSHGLKQLALSGVDIHTIGCMLMIGEFTPASPDFRKSLSKAREAQRNERLWMYKIVEIGAATNFLADQLLKTRAGENVIALLSAIIPVMSEDACIALLSTLFDLSGASLDNIPGRAQLLNIRKSLCSLARKAGIGERVLQHHHFLKQLLPKSEQQAISSDPYISIPDATQIPIVVKLLHRLATSDEKYILVVSGIRGAAWIAIYATHVLGLRTCAVDHHCTPVPISSSYEDANVIIDVGPDLPQCGLYLQGDVQEFIQFGDRKKFRDFGWCIDCSVVNFVDLHHPGLRETNEFLRISLFATIEAFNAVAEATSFFEQWTPDALFYRHDTKLQPLEFRTYVTSVISDLQLRALKILRILGFLPPSSGYKITGWNERQLRSISVVPKCTGHSSDPKTTYSIVHEGGEEYVEETAFGKTVKKSETKSRKVKHRFGQYIEHFGLMLEDELPPETTPADIMNHAGDTPHMKTLQNYLAHPDHPQEGFWKWPAASRRSISETVKVAVHFASRMVFSDWESTVRLMSVNAMSKVMNEQEDEDDRSFEGLTAEAISLCFDGIDTKTMEKRLWSDDWLAIDLDGVVALRNAAQMVNFHEVKGRFLGLRVGTIEYDGSRYSRIRTDRAYLTTRNYRLSSNEYDDEFPCVKIRNLFDSPKLRPLATAIGDTVFVRMEVHVAKSDPIIVDCSLIAKNLSDVMVMSPCSHDIESSRNWNANAKKYMGILQQGLFFDDDRDRAATVGNRLTGSPVYLQQTKDNALLQWVALQWQPTTDRERCLRVYQNKTCLSCTLDYLGLIVDSIKGSSAPLRERGYPICIIAGNSDRGVSSSLSPKPSTSRSTSPASSTGVFVTDTPQSDSQKEQQANDTVNDKSHNLSIRRKPVITS